MGKSLSESAKKMESKARKEKMSTQVLLMKAGLEEYYQYFEKAGYKFFEGGAHPSDLETDNILDVTERVRGEPFDFEVRVELWKAIRYQWWRGPGHVHTFIERTQVPRLFLPKLDYKMVDSMIKMSDIDPDRQRQMLRKTKPSGTMAFRGPAVITLQFEVFKRQKDIHYQLKDIERCVDEWQQRNPRIMTREDPREEVLKLRIKKLEDTAQAIVQERRRVQRQSLMVVRLLQGIRVIAGALAALMFTIAFWRFRNSPSEIAMDFIVGSKQFVAGVNFIITFAWMYSIESRRHPDITQNKMQRLLIKCQQLKDTISDFRVITEEMRAPLEALAPDASVFNYDGKAKEPEKEAKKPKERSVKTRDLGAGEQSRKRSRGAKKKDPTLALWCGSDAHKKLKDPVDLLEGVAKTLAESEKRLPEVQVKSGNKHSVHRDRQDHMTTMARPPRGFEESLRANIPRVPRAPQMRSISNLSSSTGALMPPPQPSLPGPPGSWPTGPNPLDRSLGQTFPATATTSSMPQGDTRGVLQDAFETTMLPAGSVPPAHAATLRSTSRGTAATPQQPSAEQPSRRTSAADLHPWLPGSLPGD